MKSRLWIGLALLLALLAGCSDGDEVLGTAATSEPTPVAQPTQAADADSAVALEISEVINGEDDRVVAVRGFVVWTDSSARLCEVLAESFPPQCGGQWITIANPAALDVELEAEAQVRWTQGFVEIEGFYDGDQLIIDDADDHGDGADDDTAVGADSGPSLADQALVDAYIGFVADPSAERLGQLNLAESVHLGLGDEIIKILSAGALIDPANWTIEREEFRAWSGPFSALWLAELPVTITVGPHPRCIADPVPAPPGFAEHRRVSLQPETATSCLEWWTVDFFIEPSGQVEAITLDLFAP